MLWDGALLYHLNTHLFESMDGLTSIKVMSDLKMTCLGAKRRMLSGTASFTHHSKTYFLSNGSNQLSGP